MARLSPLKHKNLNVLGRYNFIASSPSEALCVLPPGPLPTPSTDRTPVRTSEPAGPMPLEKPSSTAGESSQDCGIGTTVLAQVAALQRPDAGTYLRGRCPHCGQESGARPALVNT